MQVKAVTIGRDKFLRSLVAGTVYITREQVNPDMTQADMKRMYEERVNAGIVLHKLTFNVVPEVMPNRFSLVQS